MNPKTWLKSSSYLVLTAVFGMLFVQCDILGSGGSGSTEGGLTLTGSTPYVIQGNMIISTYVDTFYYCREVGLLEVTRDTFVDSQPYVLQGNTLSYTVAESLFTRDSMGYPVGNARAIVGHKIDYTRVGNGTSLQGTWKFMGYSYSVLSGALTSTDSTNQNSSWLQYIYKAIFTYYGAFELQFTATDILYYSGMQWAKFFLDDWDGTVQGFSLSDPKGADSAHYNISVSQVNQHTVQLKGNTTGEVVTLTFTDGDFPVFGFDSPVFGSDVGGFGSDVGTYASNNPQHKTHYFDSKEIPICLSDIDTSYYWINRFYTDNRKPSVMAKSTALAKQSLTSPLNREKNRHTPFLFRYSP